MLFSGKRDPLPIKVSQESMVILKKKKWLERNLRKLAEEKGSVLNTKLSEALLGKSLAEKKDV